MKTITYAAVVLALSGVAAAAQTGSNVAPPRAEGQVGSINQAIMSQQQNRSAAQQNQFETNSVRSQLNQPAPPPLVQPYGVGVPGRR